MRIHRKKQIEYFSCSASINGTEITCVPNFIDRVHLIGKNISVAMETCLLYFSHFPSTEISFSIKAYPDNIIRIFFMATNLASIFC